MPRLLRRRRALAAAAALLLAGCARVIATPPPPASPAFSEVQPVAGVPVVLAARAARALQESGFATRRFGSDSIWASRSAESAAVRLRYSRASDDSTRVLFEIWLPCAGTPRCGRAESALFFARLRQEEGMADVAP